MSKMKKVTAIAMALLLLLGLVGCSSTAESEPAETETQIAEQNAPADEVEITQVGIVTDMGLDEAEWLQNLVKGLEDYVANNEGIDIKIVEAVDVAEYEPKVRALAEAGYSIIITMNSGMAAATTAVAADYPDIRFGSHDGNIENLDSYSNISEFGLNRTETGFLAGVAGAAMSETGVAGIVAGADEPVINAIVAGWQQGLVWANPDIVDYVAYANSFTDPTIGKELALSLADKGCDVVGGAAGGTGVGAAQAAAEREIYYVAWDVHYPEVFTANQLELGSAVNWFDVMYLAFIDDVLAGNYQAGQRVEYGMNEGVCGFEYPDGSKMTDEAKAKVEEAMAAIKAGEITISAEPLHK